MLTMASWHQYGTHKQGSPCYEAQCVTHAGCHNHMQKQQNNKLNLNNDINTTLHTTAKTVCYHFMP